jgi:predicted Kef-type K+ transport protein
MTQNLKQGRELHSLSFFLVLQTTHKQINDSAYLFASSPQLAEFVVFVVNLHVHIALLQVMQGNAIILASPLSLVLFKVVSFRDKDLLPPTNLIAALANNTD